ncbi:MAG: hypothetical protein IPM38_18085 [Ignavibacteria bacterium]|nr:hypothetical protein [Ignavibacteria bacterium]
MKINKNNLYLTLALSFIVLLISIVFGILFGSFTNASQDENFTKALSNYNDWWLYPVFVYILFISFIVWVKKGLDKKFAEGNLTKSEITKTIDKWSGIVDGIGTALPLIGAAVILFTVGLGQQSQALFLDVAIPFEIKSLFILAIAKLFESAFDDLEIQYLRNVADDGEGIGNIKKMEIEIINLPSNADLNEIKSILINWNESIDKMKEPEFKKSLESITKIIGR